MTTTQTTPASKTITLEVFRSRTPSMQMVLKNGNYIAFIGGKYRTSKQAEIDELKAEIASGLSYIFQQEGAEKEIEEEDVMAGLKARMRAEIIAEEKAKMLAASGSLERDMGNYDASTKINAASSSDFAAAAPRSDSLSFVQADPAGNVQVPTIDMSAIKVKAGK